MFLGGAMLVRLCPTSATCAEYGLAAKTLVAETAACEIRSVVFATLLMLLLLLGGRIGASLVCMAVKNTVFRDGPSSLEYAIPPPPPPPLVAAAAPAPSEDRSLSVPLVPYGLYCIPLVPWSSVARVGLGGEPVGVRPVVSR